MRWWPWNKKKKEKSSEPKNLKELFDMIESWETEISEEDPKDLELKDWFKKLNEVENNIRAWEYEKESIVEQIRWIEKAIKDELKELKQEKD